MRTFLFLILTFLFQKAFTQDKNLLQKQLLEIMIDYPNKFKNLKKDLDTFHLKFRISGTTDEALILTFDKKTHLVSFLSVPRSDEEAKVLFDKWVALINTITLNGAKLTAQECVSVNLLYCKKWRIDNSKNNIDPTYLPFTIQVSVLKFQSAFAASLKIGDL